MQVAAAAAAAAAEEERRRLPAAKRRLLETRADADDMADDYALLRKVKKGKITEVCIFKTSSCVLVSRLQHHLSLAEL